MDIKPAEDKTRELFFGLFTVASPTEHHETKLSKGSVLEVTYGGDIRREYFGLSPREMENLKTAEKTFFTPFDFACNILGGIGHLKNLLTNGNPK